MNIDPDIIKKGVVEVCATHSRAREVLKKANGKKSSSEIAKEVDIGADKASTILNKAHRLKIVEKISNGVFKRKINLHDIDQALKQNGSSDLIESPIRINKRQKKVSTESIKKSITKYIEDNFSKIQHPYKEGDYASISKGDLKKASTYLFTVLDSNLQIPQLEGLSLRFYNSFASYFSADRTDKSEMVSRFSNLVQCFEPYVKKVAVIKENDTENYKIPLGKDLIPKVISFTSNINKPNSSYWEGRPVPEASIRTVFPFRHKEAHEARDYPTYEIERIIHYLIASIIFINIDHQ